MKRTSNKLFSRIRNAFAYSDRLQAQNIALNLLERTFQKTRLKSTPFSVQVDVTNRCNLNCVFCSRHHKPLKLGDLSPNLLPDIKNISRKSRELILFGYGEPLMSEAFFTLLRESESARISFTTNGLLLNQDMIYRITKEGNKPIHNVTFSIDGIQPQTYLSIRERSNFDKVWSNLKGLSEYKARNRLLWPEIWINFVAMRKNIEELPQLIEKAAKLGVSQINIFHLVVWDKSYITESLIYHTDLTSQVFDEAWTKAQELGLRLDIPIKISKKNSNNQVKLRNSSIPRCYQPWSYAYIRYDGFVQACCFSENLIMGNIAEKSFEEIWNGKPYQKLRATVNRTPSTDCRRCELRFRYTPSHNDFETYIKLKPRRK